MTDSELLELILEKISALEAKVCKIEVVVEELISETHGYARKDIRTTDL